MTENNLQTLNAIPLTDVLQGWGYVPKSETKSGSSASYLCPWHDDNHPSLVVDKVLRQGAEDLGFKCFACGQEGYGAIQLAARLMGFAAGPVPKEDLPQVLSELMSRCDVELDEESEGEQKQRYDSLRTAVMGWDDFLAAYPQYKDITEDEPVFERGEWTLEGLKAMGLKVELATRKARKSDVESAANEIKVGDTITEFNADSGEALYRCSLGKDFYRGAKAETRTIAEWGAELERLFGVEPIARFCKRDTPKQGGIVVLVVKATRNYPMFIFRYPWGVKKYEPKARLANMKWTWWNVSEDADLDHRYYADAALTDALEGALPEQDERHPYLITEKDKEGNPKQFRFVRVILCSGPRDAIAVYSHSNAHVVWLHSEQSGFNRKDGAVRPNRWMRAFIRRLQGVTAEGGLYVCYDEDKTGLMTSQAIALNSPQVHWLRLPKQLSEVKSSRRQVVNGQSSMFNVQCKDVTDFITRFGEVERLMPADLQHDDPVDWFENALYDTPTTQFWQWESSRKDKDGTERARYKFDLRNTPVFLRARGMIRRAVKQGKSTFSRFFLLGSNGTYTECFSGDKGGPNKLVTMARDIMAEWLSAHKEYNDEKGSLSRAIYSAKLEQGTLESIEAVDFDDHSFGEDFDHFFFENTAVKVTAEGWETVPYNRMKWQTNSEAILDGVFSIVHQAWRVVENPAYAGELQQHNETLRLATTPEERAQENMRWDAWASLWKYRLVMDKPLEEMPLHFRFLYNTSRIFWEKEQAGDTLSATERQVQDMYFVTMLHAIGSALVRHRSANRQQFVHITDNGTRREDLASGGTGKTAILELLALMRKVLKIDGKALEGGNIKLSQELDKVVPGLHNIVAIDELPQGFSPKTLYNYTLSLTSRGLYSASIVLEGDDLPKFVVASNEQLDLSSDSTSRRTYQVLVSDWYHPRSMDGSRPAHTPADDFKAQYGIKEVARNLPQQQLNEARNFLLGCVQLFFQLPDETLRPPRDSRALLRQALAASKDEQFTLWISAFLSDKRHLGQPIAQRELAISLLDYCGVTVGDKTLKSAFKRIRDNLDDYIRTSVYVLNPPVVLSTPTDRENGFRRCAAWQHPKNGDGSIPLDENGNRVPRELVRKAPYPRVYYFYRKGTVPRNFYDESHGHDGDKDYVQGAPDVDPEFGDNSNSSSE